MAHLIRLLVVILLLLAGISCSSGGQLRDECGPAPAGFSHRVADVDGTQIHYVVGGQGPAVVLLHGFPETWWTWRMVAPALARAHTVIAPDLRGVGCSAMRDGPDSYAADTLARDVHGVVTSLSLPRAAIVGHDTGGWVAYAYARQFRGEVSHLVLTGAAIPGFGLEKLLDFREPGPGLPHLAFFMQRDVPELLIGGREKEYFDRFITSDAMRRSGAVDVYAQSYARPGRLTAALGQYRALYTDAAANRRDAGPPLTMPTLALGGTEAELSADGLRRVAASVDELTIPETSHYVQEEKPAEFASAVAQFISR